MFPKNDGGEPRGVEEASPSPLRGALKEETPSPPDEALVDKDEAATTACAGTGAGAGAGAVDLARERERLREPERSVERERLRGIDTAREKL